MRCNVLFCQETIALLSLAFSMLVWDDHVRESSSIRPRYFTCFEIYICWPLILNFSFFVIFFPFGQNMIIWVLSTLTDILLVLSQWAIRFKSWFIYLFIFFIELREYKRFVSSAKWCIFECWITLLISFVYIPGIRVAQELSLVVYHVCWVRCLN